MLRIFTTESLKLQSLTKIALLLVVLTIFYISFIFVNNISLMELPQNGTDILQTGQEQL